MWNINKFPYKFTPQIDYPVPAKLAIKQRVHCFIRIPVSGNKFKPSQASATNFNLKMNFKFMLLFSCLVILGKSLQKNQQHRVLSSHHFLLCAYTYSHSKLPACDGSKRSWSSRNGVRWYAAPKDSEKLHQASSDTGGTWKGQAWFIEQALISKPPHISTVQQA